jgi:hypothetical protein
MPLNRITKLCFTILGPRWRLPFYLRLCEGRSVLFQAEDAARSATKQGSGSCSAAWFAGFTRVYAEGTGAGAGAVQQLTPCAWHSFAA